MSHFYQEPALEAISFTQDSRLAAALLEGVKTLRMEEKKAKRLPAKLFTDIDFPAIIRKHTGLLVTLETCEHDDAYVLIPDLNRNNVIISDFRRVYFESKDSERFLLKNNIVKGTVDLKEGRVTGDFTDVRSIITMGKPILTGNGMYTPEEAVAVFLHEIGHILVSMEMVARYTRTNLIMLEGTRRMMEASTHELRVRLLRDLETSFGATIEDIEDAADRSRNPNYYQTLVLQSAIAESDKQLDVNIYDVRVFEQLADQYVARNGYGRHLATGLDKLYKSQGHSTYRSNTVAIIINVLKIVAFITTAVVALYAVLYGGSGAQLVNNVGVNIFIVLGTFILSNPLVLMYDKAPDRIGKIKLEIQGELRNRDLSAEEKRALLDDLKVLDGVLETMHNREDVYEFIWSRIYPWGRKPSQIVKVNMELEKLLNNPLYRAAAELSIIKVGA